MAINRRPLPITGSRLPPANPLISALLQNRHSPPIPLYCSLTDRSSAMQRCVRRSRRFFALSLSLSLSPSSSPITTPWSGHGAAPSVGFGQVQPLLGLFPCRCSYRLTARCCQLHRRTAAAGAVQPGSPRGDPRHRRWSPRQLLGLKAKFFNSHCLDYFVESLGQLV
ncbi:hypothetical protein SASPL_111067 [Salvia splendens]|uniref:Uncharacterized protein n=1 Tax=Salvia splendens TaxID=180675 RepID=A0A8X8Y6L0_SALSN|nr:hypothetical protein SASPL_111067 [Salvia splendens]